MENLLEKYNQLHTNTKEHSKTPDSEKGFIDFLYENTEDLIPDVEVDLAWKKVQRKIYKKKVFVFWKVAASVSIICMVAVALGLRIIPIKQTEVVTAAETTNVQLPDGSTGVLNKNSSINYKETYWGVRSVEFMGEAFFEVKSTDKPFVISINDIKVKVLGTSFNLKVTDEFVSLYVIEGKVEMINKHNQTFLVKTGQEARLNKQNQTFKELEKLSDNLMSWRTNIFSFQNTPLGKVFETLEKHYGTTFELETKEISNCKITAKFDDFTLTEVLEIIDQIVNIETKQINQKIVVIGKGC